MLEWNVYVEDVNAQKIVVYNIFRHTFFVRDCKKALKEHKEDKDSFLEEVRKELMYYFWSKCEWEIILSDFPPSGRFKEEKVDVYDQVRLNWKVFSEYLWNNRELLDKIKEK